MDPKPYLAGFSMMGLMLAATPGIFTISLGYSRILYALGVEGNLFRILGRVHAKGHCPAVSLLPINALAIPSAGFRLNAWCPLS
jgi:amino acid transporter